jgi:hypothetical protein
MPCAVSRSGADWVATTDVRDLLARTPPPSPVRAAEWALFVLDAGGTSYPLETDRFLCGRLPVTLRPDGRRVVIRPRTGTFHLTVD